MALVKVYDLLNAEHEMESVDAKECVAEMGWTMAPQAPADPEPAPVEEKHRGRK